jgi:hypothetical protein
MVELQVRPLRASPSFGRDAGALAPVAPPDRAPDGSRDVARGDGALPDRRIRPRTDRPRRPGLGRRPQLRPLDLLEQKAQGAVEDGARIAVRDLTAEEGLNPPKLVVGLRADGELHPEPLRRRGLDDRTGCRNERGGRRSRGTCRFARRAGHPLVGGCRQGGRGRGPGSLRRDDGTSGRGASSATRASISSRFRPLALARTAS